MTITQEELANFRWKAQQEYPNFGCRQAQKLMAYLDETIARAAKAEAERDWLADILERGAHECPYLEFWADGCDWEIPDWCQCSDTDEYGFECSGDPKLCWLEWAAHEARQASDSAKSEEK